MKTVVIDIGSSFLKAAVLDVENACIVDERKFPSPEKLRYEDPYLFEVPADVYVDFVKGLVDEYAGTFPDLEGLLLSTQMHGFIYSIPGKPDVYISWQDMRCLHKVKGSDENYLTLLQKIFPPESMEDCGVYIKPALGMANLYTMLHEDPSIPRDGTLYTLGSYIIAKLTGNNICHATNAGPLGLLNVKKHCWHEDVIRTAGLEQVKLPRLAQTDFEVCGVYETCGKSIKVFPDYGDQQVCVVGSLPRKGEGLINIATASQVGRITDSFIPGSYEIRPYFDDLYLTTVSNMPAGRGLDVLIHFLQSTVEAVTGEKPTVPQMWDAIAKDFRQDAAGLEVDMTFYATAAKPDGGHIKGIHQHNLSLSTLFSAAFEDMAKTYKEHLAILSGGEKLPAVVCSGGVSWKRPELIAQIRKTMGCDCRLSALKDEAMSGLYRVALCCMGICTGLEDKPHLLLQLKAK